MAKDTQETRYAHRTLIEGALREARLAFASAKHHGRRQDCLREAVRSLEGALRNVEGEDVEWEQAQAAKR